MDRWLQGGEFRVQRFDDVYSACVYLVTNPDSPPDLVVVGASWLTRDELAIIDYVEQTWPDAPLMVYGVSDDGGRIGASQRVRVCRSSAELRLLLEQSPAELASSAPDSADDPPIARPPCDDPGPSARRDELDDVELTREELAALLEDSER